MSDVRKLASLLYSIERRGTTELKEGSYAPLHLEMATNLLEKEELRNALIEALELQVDGCPCAMCRADKRIERALKELLVDSQLPILSRFVAGIMSSYTGARRENEMAIFNKFTLELAKVEAVKRKAFTDKKFRAAKQKADTYTAPNFVDVLLQQLKDDGFEVQVFDLNKESKH